MTEITAKQNYHRIWIAIEETFAKLTLNGTKLISDDILLNMSVFVSKCANFASPNADAVHVRSIFLPLQDVLRITFIFDHRY